MVKNKDLEVVVECGEQQCAVRRCTRRLGERACCKMHFLDKTGVKM